MAAVAAFTFNSCADVPEPYTQPQKPDDSSSDATGEATGSGTLADPFNVAGAIKYIEDGGDATTEMYVKGKVVSVKSGSYDSNYGSLKYYISDDGTSTNQFYVYNGYAGANRTKFSGEDALKAGDEVVICGLLIEYTGTKEFQTGNYLVSLNGQSTGGSTTPDTPTTGKGSEADPYTVAEAIEVIKAGAPSTEVYLKGIISEVSYYNSNYKSLSYYISDDGKSNDMQVYSGKGLNGADFSSKEDLKVGQKVTIKGIIKQYNTTMEVDKNSTIVKIEDGGSTTPDTPATSGSLSIDGTTVTLTNSSVTAGESITLDLSAQNYENSQTIEKIELSDGTTIVFDANGETNGPKYYTITKGIRLYKNNKITFNGKSNIAKIIMTCDTYSGTNYVGNETATVEFSGKTATYTNVFTGTSGGGVQLRVKNIEIVYAK